MPFDLPLFAKNKLSEQSTFHFGQEISLKKLYKIAGQRWRFLNARPKKLKNRARQWKYQIGKLKLTYTRLEVSPRCLKELSQGVEQNS